MSIHQAHATLEQLRQRARTATDVRHIVDQMRVIQNWMVRCTQ